MIKLNDVFVKASRDRGGEWLAEELRNAYDIILANQVYELGVQGRKGLAEDIELADLLLEAQAEKIKELQAEVSALQAAKAKG